MLSELTAAVQAGFAANQPFAISETDLLVTPAIRFRSLHTPSVVCNLPFSSRSGRIP